MKVQLFTKLIILVDNRLPGPCVFLIKPTFASRKALLGRKFIIVACFINPLAKVDKPGDESHQRRRGARFWLEKTVRAKSAAMRQSPVNAPQKGGCLNKQFPL